MDTMTTTKFIPNPDRPTTPTDRDMTWDTQLVNDRFNAGKPVSYTDAVQMTEYLRGAMQDVAKHLARCISGSVWLAYPDNKYPTFTAWFQGEGLHEIRVPNYLRTDIIFRMTADGASINAISKATGAALNTVRATQDKVGLRPTKQTSATPPSKKTPAKKAPPTTSARKKSTPAEPDPHDHSFDGEYFIDSATGNHKIRCDRCMHTKFHSPFSNSLDGPPEACNLLHEYKNPLTQPDLPVEAKLNSTVNTYGGNDVSSSTPTQTFEEIVELMDQVGQKFEVETSPAKVDNPRIKWIGLMRDVGEVLPQPYTPERIKKWIQIQREILDQLESSIQEYEQG